MPKRDWAKDWEMCWRATPKPWVYDYNGFIYPTKDVSELGFPRDWPESLYKGDRVGSGPAICRVFHIEIFEDRKHDVEFIAEAREALPYWLQRVRELEKKLAKFEHFVMAFRKLRREKALASTCVQCALRQIRGDDYCSTHKDAVTAAEEELEQALKDLGEVDNHAKNS